MSRGQFLCSYQHAFIHIVCSISQCFGMHSHSLLDIFISEIYSSYIMWLLIKQRFSSLRHGWPLPILAILFRYIGFIVPRNIKLFGFPILSVTWWRLFQKRIVRTKFDIYVCIQEIFMICFTNNKWWLGHRSH